MTQIPSVRLKVTFVVATDNASRGPSASACKVLAPIRPCNGESVDEFAIALYLLFQAQMT